MSEPYRLSSVLSDLESLVATGIVPTTVASFSELHDFVDANCLGGLCEGEMFDGLIAHFGGRDEHGGMPQAMPQAMLDLINQAQYAIDLLIKSGFFQEISK